MVRFSGSLWRGVFFVGKEQQQRLNYFGDEFGAAADPGLRVDGDDRVIVHPFFKCLKTLTSDPRTKRDAGLSSAPGRGRRSLNGGPRL